MKTLNFALKYPFSLQLFAEPEADPAAEGAQETDSEETGSKEEPEKAAKTYTQEELDNIIRKRVKRAEDKARKEAEEAAATQIENARTEAEKLARMNEEQKRQYEEEKKAKEMDDLRAENERLKKAQEHADLSRQAADMLQSDHNITATQDILDFVVGDDADTTKSRIDKFVAIIKADRKAVEAERATGKTPKSFNNGKNELSEFQKRLNKYKK